MKAGDTYYVLDQFGEIRHATVVFVDPKTVLLDETTHIRGIVLRVSTTPRQMASDIASGHAFMRRGYKPREGWGELDWKRALFTQPPTRVRLLALQALLTVAQDEARTAQAYERFRREDYLSAMRRSARLRKRIAAAQKGQA